MNAIQSFNFNQSQVRVEIHNSEPFFCLADVTRILGINRRSAEAFRFNPKGCKEIATLTNGGKQLLTFISEPNLYRVIFRSNKTEAVKFQDWIFEEVIPQIRKTGGYQIPPKTTVADRTPLRQAVSALVGRCGFDYSAAYHLVHQRFGVGSIEEIAAEDLPEAVEYVHMLTVYGGMCGEVLEKQPAPQGVVLTERQMGHFAAGAYMLDLATRRLADLSEPLKMLGARDKGVSAWTIRDEAEIWIKNCRSALEAVLPQMGDNFYRGSVQESLRMMDALAAR